MPEARSASGAQPVMADVAALAGVSHQTVSRVLNGSPNVRAQTRERVLAAIRTLDYRPNTAARALVTRRSRTLGVISFDSTLYGPSQMLYGIEQAARGAGYFLSIASLRHQDTRSVHEAVDRLRDQAVEGIAVIASRASAMAALARQITTVPMVTVGPADPGRLSGAGVDNEAGARAAVRYLLDQGHRTVHHVAGPDDWLEAKARQAGWRRTLEDRERPVPESTVGDWSARSGYRAALRLVDDPRMTAVFCANDHMALGFVRALHERGRRVPEDVSVVGFDDIPEAGFLNPPLSTVRQDFGELGRRGLGLLLHRIQFPDSEAAGLDGDHHVAIVAPELIVRASSARPDR
ncbi:LacI family DNA-binding transcriptional regulator [Kitasatospora sp. RB6PN24]|uniref:LacI family DNA-binding transcriptional regulator n=1 Tax=Kitasatospora humi TaxID=2893891 RepID=UPI001E34B045|nr:LacI family DNA-binding transcriptional regulator [Kitasatospora humi]MCC9306509.1 LacI family DNA-binding transcriptional regulator [Kitasatospora humi]